MTFVKSNYWLVDISPNLRAYYDLWKKTLMQNRDESAAEEGAKALTMHRMDSQKRGMPDMHPDEESEIMGEAFKIHAAKVSTGKEGHRNLSSGSMTCFWCEDLTHVCHCFEEARHEHIVNKLIAEKPPMPAEDPWYEPRFV